MVSCPIASDFNHVHPDMLCAIGKVRPKANGAEEGVRAEEYHDNLQFRTGCLKSSGVFICEFVINFQNL